MKLSFLVAALAFLLGLGLLIFGTSGTAEMMLMGITFHPRLTKGAGIIVMIFSIIAFPAAWGGSLPPQQHGNRRG